MRAVFTLSRLVFGALFVYAGAEKVMDAQAFAAVIFNYQVLPAKMVYGAAMLLPALEVVCGLALCVGTLARGAAVVLNVLMAVFMALMGWAMVRGLDVTCGCFGGAGQAVSKETLVRDGLILLLGLVALWGAFSGGKDCDRC
ncbi:MauE/DoxX family redox-associated membrane protein [Fundidesulfovibrio agrisoli]|uniref:MauE/DoxX family redox-associated membrane protein n=1 Tax=Fundidesulfovibrio agrisoli TaxID=2922717 RepID=UPI001FABB638|nr:MauE/DoxX family redox-associated membrane protein [Fundidesulfovibrio agrisoli]